MQLFDRNVHKNHRGFDLHIQRSVSAVALGLLLFPVCAFSQITVIPATGGVTNTGNAAVGDVASGKTFSSSVLTNATGTSTKDATVGGSAPIQPPQAFVDATAALIVDLDNTRAGTFVLANKGITNLSSGYLDAVLAYSGITVGYLELNASGNALSAAAVNLILSKIALVSGSFTGVIDLSGGTNAAPTGQGITDKNTLIAAGWTVTVNP